MRWFTLEEYVGGIFLFVLIVAVTVAVIYVVSKGANKRAAKFKEENPEAATIWALDKIINGVFMTAKIKKVDGQKAVSFGGWSKGPYGTYILPGTHTLTMEHVDASKMDDKAFKKQKMSQISVTIEPSKEYILNFCEIPGQYSLTEGKPE